ncbi:response regulator transcription factor [Natranaerofaba carboxydovora]|uniref:response regulator transcription factor n=1 Tax=Natranaerofaba carboxydovora TaxID=2742683 RepID=UPI001F12951C|nr:LuxR C-terminal-related transcriptional regulator [Natranaerofaba carboxydovora]
MGALSSVYILGWSCLYSMCIPFNNKIKTMAAIIIISNAVFVLINWLSTYLSSIQLLTVAILPLIASMVILVKIPELLKLEIKPAKNTKKDDSPLPLPKTLIIFCIFVAGLFLNGGFMYNIMLPSFEGELPFFKNYTYLPYILVLLIIFKLSSKIKYYLLVYMGVTLLGMSFVSFALLGDNIVGLFLTHTLVESSFAFLDLFVWVALGNLAFIYGAPYQLFGYVLGVMVSSIFAGNIIGSQIFQIGETHRLIMAVFAATAIFLTHLVIPWLNKRINSDFTTMVAVTMEDETLAEEKDIFDILLGQLLPGENLTPREKEVTKLILKGLKNKEIAEQLFISDNTLKSHLRNIYPKFGVTQKRELLSIALNIKKYKN